MLFQLKNFILYSAILLLLTGNSWGQSALKSEHSWEGHSLLYGSYQFRRLPEILDIHYYGISGEYYFNNGLTFSGSMFIGNGSNYSQYLHLPLLGFATSLLFSIFLEPQPDFLILILFENLGYQYQVNKHFTLIPYMNAIAADLGEASRGQYGDSLLSSGLGIMVKYKITRKLRAVADSSVKYFWGTQAGGSDTIGQAGFTLGLSLGYHFH
jgi:hypothetical protein